MFVIILDIKHGVLHKANDQNNAYGIDDIRLFCFDMKGKCKGI